MNLAYKDIRHHFGRFTLTAIGIGLLLMIVMGMGGIYRGLVEEATLLVDAIGADFWVVQNGTRGPFAEVSRVPSNLVHRVAAVPGVSNAREFVFHTIQREHRGKPMRMAVLGLSWPVDKGAWLPLLTGRPLAEGHFEMIADKTLGLSLNESIRLGQETYTVVGITNGMVGSGGDGLAFFTLSDAQAIQFDLPGETVRLERSARQARLVGMDWGATQPNLVDRAASQSSEIPSLGPPQISAVIASIAPGTDLRSVTSILSGWEDVSVHSRQDQIDLLLQGMVDKARRQLGLFSALLTIISAIIMALILYTLTLDKIHDIALLKLIGAPNKVILGLILQQGLVLGSLGYGLAYLIGQKLFPLFPRRVVLTDDDLVRLAFIVLGISVLASLLGIWKALRVTPNEALSG
ncbi:MAG: putative ABC transporter permease [bacterium]|nr:putative ABC transporter permease [bacterium]